MVADYFVIASGRTDTQVQAIAENVIEKLKEAGETLFRREGFREGLWVLLDFGNVVVHLFREEERRFYDLERLWGDAPLVPYVDDSAN